MWFIELGTICETVAVVVRVWWLVVQVLRARNKRRLLSRMFGVVSDSPDFIGISAICHDIDSVSQVADLLDVEYASYELLVVMDARLKPELFHEMLRHYRMMRVDYHPFEACSQLGVRGFYRSQTRGVNRLTLLDQMEAFSAVSSDAAVRAASYDYILPIGRNLRLKRGAIDLLAMELAVHPIHSISFVRTAVGPSLRLYAREYVGRLGRVDRADGYELSRKERITLYEPLFYELRPSRHNPDIRREMDAQAKIVGAWEDAKRVPDQKRLTWFYPDFGSYVPKEHITPEQLAAAARGVERKQASRAYKESKRPISQQMQDAAKQAEADRGQSAPKKNAPDRGDR